MTKKPAPQPGQQPGMVIILNGPSSVGKTSIIRAFQAKQTVPWLEAGLDNFYVRIIPPVWLDDKPEHQSIMTVTHSQDPATQKPIVTAVFGPEGRKVVRGMHHAIAAYARAGNRVIVDYIQYDPSWVGELQEALQGIPVLWVGVTAPLASIEEREKKRGTSPQGHARSHYATVHQGMKYDVMLDTDALTPEQCADKIIERLQRN